MQREVVQPADRPRPTYPFSLGIRYGDLVFTSGQVGRDAKGQMTPDLRGQTRNALENLRGVLAAGGSSLDRVLKVTVYMTDIREFEAMNGVYKEFFPIDPPCRSTVAVAALGKPEMRVEIEAIACRRQ